MTEVIVIKNWKKFQHYKDRNPPWIKLATDTFQDYEFSKMSDASKLLAVCIWTLASRSMDGKVPYDLVWIVQQCNLKTITDNDLKELINSGFIYVFSDASEVLADRKQTACPETEAYRKEAETETEAERARFENKGMKNGKITGETEGRRIAEKILSGSYAMEG